MIRYPFGMQQVLHVWITLKKTLLQVTESRSQRQIYALELHFYCKLLACFMSWSQKGLKQDLDTQSKLEGEINNSDLNKSFWQTKSLWKNR